MKTTWIALLALALYSTWTRGQVPLVQEAAKRTAVKDIVDIELLTHTEIHDKIHKEGKTAVLIVNGGTEQRGPQNVLGGHTLMGHMKAIAIAKKLGNALVAPSLPYATSPNGLSEATPGGVGLPSEIFKAVKTAEVESMATNGFKTIFLMGDHGGGQAEMEQVARDEDRKLSARGVRVHYIGDFYYKAHDDFDLYCYERKLPIQAHGGIMDTSQMMYLEPAPGLYTRPIYKTVPYDDGPDNEQWKADYDRRRKTGGRVSNVAVGAPRGARTNRDGSPRGNNGIAGNPHPSSLELGKLSVDIAVDDAVAEIRRVLSQRSPGMQGSAGRD
jgi:creatinine amidohydrolase/Fe(II)-dependent formamide hydrolase-like protein